MLSVHQPSRASASKSVSINLPLLISYLPTPTSKEHMCHGHSTSSHLHSTPPIPSTFALETLRNTAPGNVNHRQSRCSQMTVSLSFYFGSNVKFLGRFGRSCVELRQTWVILGGPRCSEGAWLPSSLYKAILNKLDCFWKRCPACCGQENGRCPCLVGNLFGL